MARSNKKKREARKRLLLQAITTETSTVTPPPVPTPDPPSSIPEAPEFHSGGGPRYVGWVQNSEGEWVGQIGPQQRPYRSFKLKTAKNVGVLDPVSGARYANASRYAQWQLDATEADLPGLLPINSAQQRVDRISRLAASLVENTKISVNKLSTVKWGKKFYLPGVVFMIDLAPALDELAAGRARTWEHARANTVHGNRERLLENANQDRYDPVYLEFGWLYPVPDSLFTTLRRDFGRYEPIWFRGRVNGQRWVPRMVSEQILRFKPDPLKPKPSDDALLRDQLALTKLVLDQGKCIDVGLRLIISDGGDVYFTADHYETFYRYSEDAIKDDDETGSWVPYISPEVRYQLKRNEFMLPDASWYWPERPIMHEKVWSMRNW